MAFMDGKKSSVQERKRSEYVLQLLSKMVSEMGYSCNEHGKDVPGDFSVALTGNVEGNIGSSKLSVVVSGVMEGSEMEKVTGKKNK